VSANDVTTVVAGACGYDASARRNAHLQKRVGSL